MPVPPPSEADEIAELLVRGYRELFGNEPASDVISRLCDYFAQLSRWNRKINLVGRDTPTNWIDSHFLDSMVIADLAAASEDMADIGSGAGFPPLVLKCLYPDLPVTMIEPRRKRAVFLRQTARVLGLTGLRVAEKRAEECDGEFSLVTSRALAETRKFLALAAPLCKDGGVAATLKGKNIAGEMSRFAKDPMAATFTLREIRPYTLPASGRQRNLVVFEKK